MRALLHCPSLCPLLALLALACAPARPVAEGPAVVLITVDTLRADHLGCYGFPHGTSPRIDALADSGVVFERALAASSATMPSHASIFSSRYVREHSVGYQNGGSRLEGVPLLTEAFRDAGYATGAFIGNVVLRRGRGLETGFDVFDDELPDAEPNRPVIFERVAEQTTGRALAWLAKQEGAPFFLWVHYQDPHGPYAAPGAFRGRFRLPPAEDERPLPLRDDQSGTGGIPAYQAIAGVRLPSVYRSRYADEIFYADRSIGALVEAAERAAGERGAVVLLTADHGESMGEADEYFSHAVTTPDVARVPLIVRAPGVAPGRRDALVHHVDVMPTLLDLAGLAAPPGLRGVSLAPLLRGAGTVPDRVLYTDNGHEVTAYGDGVFVRVTDLRGAWGEDVSLAPTWRRYTWRPGEPWRETRRTGGIELDALGAYYRDPVPMVFTDDLSDDDVARLRKLGYVE